LYALKTSNGEFKRGSKGKIQYDEVLINRHFLEARRQAGEGNWKTKYFAGNAFLTGAYEEYVKHIENTHQDSRDKKFLQQMLYPPGLFCEALQG
jgi:hypothetical protein